MGRQKSFLCLLLLLAATAWAGDTKQALAEKKTQPKNPGIDLVATADPKPRVDYTRVPLSFEPNRGQSAGNAKFVGNSHGYTIKLDQTGASFQFNGKDKASSAALRMEFENANRQAILTGESPLPGKADYFPTGDPKSWITNVPTY